MDKATLEHTLEQLSMRASSDMVAFNALAIIEAYQRGEDPLEASPRRDALAHAVAHKHQAPTEPELDLPAPKKGRKK